VSAAPRLSHLRGAQHRAGAVNQQHAQVAVAAFAHAAQVAMPARGMLARWQAQPGGEVPTAAKTLPATAARDETMILVGQGQFKNVFCRVNGDGRSMHGGLLS
jgi:hypothetical protein